jgi:tetratricopeptide (TPR) repeat protein
MKQQPKPPIATVDLAIGLGLILTILAVYADVGRFDFTSYDDNLYVSENVHVQAGLTPESIKWASTAVVASNWMPVTLLSHMLDCQLFHLQSGMHHLMNVVLHLLASLLLFVALKRATVARWPSAFVAFVFALHPLHVESVAWVAERKDVLSACFFFLALYAYVHYVEQPGLRRYLMLAAAFCLGLMAKPMLVTFPFVLLLFDLWPLRRLNLPHIIWEKLPLIALSVAVSVVTFYIQRSTAAVQSFPLPVRIGNALISYVVYVAQMVWPSGLAVLYPYQQSPAVWQAAAALVLLAGVSALVLRQWRTRPYLATGWFWYLGTLVPVIGLVQVGLQSRADRYMYLPMVGLLIMVAWGAADVLAKWPQFKVPIAVAAAVACTACLLVARTQTAYWENSGTLFQRAIEVTHDNYVADYNLGNYLMNTHRRQEAIPYFEAALRVHPDYPEAENNLGMIFGGLPGRMADAIPHFAAAVRLRPSLMEAQLNLAVALEQSGRTAEAITQYENLQRMQPTPEVAQIINRLKGAQK